MRLQRVLYIQFTSLQWMLSVVVLVIVSNMTTLHILFYFILIICFPGGSDCRESACNARDPDSVPGLGRSLGGEIATQSSILAWEIPWTEPGGLPSTGLQRVRCE